MDLTGDAIRTMLEAGRKSASFQTHVTPGGDEQIIVDSSGTGTRVPIPPKPRDHVLGNLDDLISLVKRFSGPNFGDPTAPHISIWHSDSQVTVVLDDGDSDRRKHRATLPLRMSKQFLLLKNWQETRPAMSQKQLIQVLRIDLSGSVKHDDIKTFRALTFRDNKDGGATVEHGKETFGKKVIAEVAGVSAIPEEITLEVPVYDNAGLNAPIPIHCAVEIDPIEGVFWIIPLSDSMTSAMQSRQERIRAVLENALHAPQTQPGDPERDPNGVFCTNVFIYEGQPTA